MLRKSSSPEVFGMKCSSPSSIFTSNSIVLPSASSFSLPGDAVHFAGRSGPLARRDDRLELSALRRGCLEVARDLVERRAVIADLAARAELRAVDGRLVLRERLVVRVGGAGGLRRIDLRCVHRRI